jgi:glycosyltransferase involved in cell wall biosynthesis
MKILQVYKDYYPPVKGGIEGHIHLISRRLAKRGLMRVSVLVSNTCFRWSREDLDGIEVTKVPQMGRISSAPISLTFPYWLRRMGKWADLLHFHFPNPTAEASYLLSGLEQKVVVSYHSDIVRQAILGKLYSPFQTRFLQRARSIFVASPNYLASSPVLHPFKNKCRIIPYGIDIDRFRISGTTAHAVKRIRKQYGDRLMLFIGRFRYYKGLDVLIKALPTIDGRLLIVGSGPLERQLREHVSRLGVTDKTEFLGELADEVMIQFLHACDIFVLPSNMRSEAFGIVQLEAMACGKPLLSTEIGTGTSFVNQHDVTGMVVAPNDHRALAQAADRMLDDPELRVRYGRAGFQRVRADFEINSMVDAVADVYRVELGQEGS